MSASAALDLSSTFALIILGLSLLISVARIVVGPTLGDRVLALDLLTVLSMGFVAVLSIRTGQFFYVDIAIALALLGFLATIAFARYILSRARKGGGHQ